MEPITFVFKDNNWLNAFPRDLIDIISWKGEIYSVPVNIHRSNVLWYNKKIFSDNKLPPPSSFDQLEKLCDTLATKGITPLALGDNGIWASVHLLESVLLATMGPARYKGLWTGATPWDGGELRTALSRFATLLRYVNTDHATLSWDAAAQYVIDGRCAMTVMGDWAEGYFKAKGFTPDKEFGWVPFPGTKGTFMMLSDSFGLPRGAPDRDAAVKWLTVAASREGQDAFNPKKGSIPSRTDCDRTLYDAYLQSAMDSFRTDTIVPSLTHGAAAAEAWVNQIQGIIGLFVCDLDIEKAASRLVAAARGFVR
jgi:glucose/mannose transport system substrate-binding protein